MQEETKNKILKQIPDEKKADPVTFKKTAIELALENLKKRGIANETEVNQLKEIYKNDDRNITEVFNEIDNLKREDVNSKLALPEPAKISMENIYDISKDGKDYILLRNPDTEELRMVENPSGIKAEKIFKELQDDIKASDTSEIINILIKKVGKSDQPEEELKDASLEFGDGVVDSKNEVFLIDYDKWAKNRASYTKLSSQDLEMLNVVHKLISKEKAGDSWDKYVENRKKPPEELGSLDDKRITVSPSEGIIMICDRENNLQKKLGLQKDANGEYKLVSLDANGYETNLDEQEVSEEYNEDSNNKEKKLTTEESEKLPGPSYKKKRPIKNADPREAA